MTMMRVFLPAWLVLWTAYAGAADLAGLDEKALRAAGVDPTPQGLKAELVALAGKPADPAGDQRLLHVARLAGQRQFSPLAADLEACCLRMRQPVARQAVARAIAQLADRTGLQKPENLVASANPAAIVLGIELLRPQGAGPATAAANPASADALAAAARSGGWHACQAAGVLKAMGDRRSVAIARARMEGSDPILRAACFRLLDLGDRPAGFEAFLTRSAPPGVANWVGPGLAPPPEGMVLVAEKPSRIIDLDGSGAVLSTREVPFRPVLASRPAPGLMLTVVPTRYWVQKDSGEIVFPCDAGSGPQNDALSVGDGSFIACDGGSFSPTLAGRTSGLYVFGPTARRVGWRLEVESPLTVRFGPSGTLLTARGELGLAWLDGTTGKPVCQVKLPAPCQAAENLPGGDALAGAGKGLYRVNPAGAVVWSFELPGEVTGIAVRGELEYFVSVSGEGLMRVDASDLDKPETKLILPVKDGNCRVTANR